MNGPRGNRPELFEPGARVLYVKARREFKREDGSTGVKLDKARGTVEKHTERHVYIDGERVPKADVLGPDRIPEGHRVYSIVVHHASGCIFHIEEHGKTAEDAKVRLKAKLDKMLPNGGWSAGGATWIRDDNT